MLSYFFTSNPDQAKKMSNFYFLLNVTYILEPGKLEDILFSVKKNPNSNGNTLSPDDYLKRNANNMPILETQEEQNSTKYYLDGFKLDLDEEYSGQPNTPRLATKDKAFISRPSKSEKHGSGSQIDIEKGSHKEIKEEMKEEVKIDGKTNGKVETKNDIKVETKGEIKVGTREDIKVGTKGEIHEEIKPQVREVRQEISVSKEEVKEHKEDMKQTKAAAPVIKPEPVVQEKVPSSDSIKSFEEMDNMDSQPNIIRENPPKTNKDILALKLTFTDKGPRSIVPMSKDVLPTSKDKDKEKMEDLIRSKSDGSAR